MMSFDQIRQSHQRDWPARKRFEGNILAFDPGETTGICQFSATPDSVSLINQVQQKTWPLNNAVRHFETIVKYVKPKIVVFERYGVYHWKTDQHAGSEVPTLQVIGCLKTICIQNQINFFSQTAQIAKQFCTDEKLKAWGFDPEGKRHARDATRHACYYLLFGHKED